LSATSKPWAPWYVIPADSKTTRNLLISTLLRDHLAALEMTYPVPAADYTGLKVE